MLEEESKALQEVAKATGKGIDIIASAGGFFGAIFGETLVQLGGTVADWARYFRYKNFLRIAEKTQAILNTRKLSGKPVPIPPQFALPLFDGASLEAEEDIQNLWAALIANAIDPDYLLEIRKGFLEILRGLEPLDARIIQFLSDSKLDSQYSMMTGATLSAEVLSSSLNVDIEDVKVSLHTLARFSCIIDSWENTLESLDMGYGGFRVGNPKSNFRLSHLGRQLAQATKST